MSAILPPSTFGTPTYGPFQDHTVQTYFRFTDPHFSVQNGHHYDLQLVKPAPHRDEVVAKLYHYRLDR